MRIETDQRNFGGSWRSLRAARSDRHDLADREGPTRTMADQGGVTEDSRRNGPHCGDLPTVVGAIWRTNVCTPAQHYRHPDPCMCDCSLRTSLLMAVASKIDTTRSDEIVPNFHDRVRANSARNLRS